jgi:pimeloyl-ACP methyl ester carboxylesterase
MTQRHLIDTIVGPLAVRVVGDGPTAVLWPSLFMDGRSWDRVLPALAQDRRLVVLDGPGHGASGDPGHPYDLRDCVNAAGQILDRLAVTDPVDWVGNAWGGHVGLLFAADRPSQCRTLVTLGTPVAALSRAERRRTYPLLFVHGVLGPIELVLSGVTEALLSGHTRAGDPESVELVRDSLRRANRRMLRNAVRSISLGRQDLSSLLPQITAPTLMVTGSDHSGFTPSQAQAAAHLIPNGRATIVADAAYLVPLEAPEETATIVREFWAQYAAELRDSGSPREVPVGGRSSVAPDPPHREPWR